jgi:hypothetical protein
MFNRRTRQYVFQFILFMLLNWMLAAAQANPASPTIPPNKSQTEIQAKSSAQAPVHGSEYSGMYSFLKDGEFVQITVEAQGHVTGFISRYGDTEGDRGVFLDHFFEAGKLDGNQLTFATKTVHGISFEFHGTIDRGEGKSRGDDAFYILKGTLTEKAIDEAKKSSSHAREVALKSFPQDVNP